MDKYMKLVKTYLFEESLETDSTGTVSIICPLLLDELTSESAKYNVWVVVFENNNATNENYRADYIIANGTALGVAYTTVRGGRGNSSSGWTSRSFYVSAGTVAKIYALYTD